MRSCPGAWSRESWREGERVREVPGNGIREGPIYKLFLDETFLG